MRKLSGCFFCLLFLVSAVNAAQISLEVVGQGMPKYPIAISPLKNTGATADPGRISTGIADSIVYDLDLSGWFRVLDRAAYIEDPQKSGDTLGGFDFKDWSTIGAVGLVKGRFAVQGDDLTVELRLFDVANPKNSSASVTVAKAKIFAASRINSLTRLLTSLRVIPGVFNTRIAYVSTSGGRFKEIHIAHLDGTERFQVTNNRTINLFPSWTSDGKSVFILSYKDRSPGLYQFELFTGKEVKWSPANGRYIGGQASPDGQM